MELSRLRSSSSSSTPELKYDVFLNFRGDDTRNNFTSHLHKALCDKKIETFIDYDLERGDEISPSLLKAIEESRISVVVFSKDYASSRWCLEELVKILECRKKYNQIVMPVFYGVEPVHVRNQTGDFADAFADHEQRFNLDKVQEWKDVLKQVGNFSGWDSDTIKPESALTEKIVEDILKRLNDDKNLVGIYSMTFPNGKNSFAHPGVSKNGLPYNYGPVWYCCVVGRIVFESAMGGIAFGIAVGRIC